MRKNIDYKMLYVKFLSLVWKINMYCEGFRILYINLSYINYFVFGFLRLLYINF